MLKALLFSAAIIGAGVISASAQSNMQGGAGADMSAATHCKDTNGHARMKTAGNTTGSATAGSSAGQTGGAGERPAGGAPPATGSSGGPMAGGGPAASGGTSTSGSAASNLPNC